MRGRPATRKGRTVRVLGTSLRVALPPIPHHRTIIASSCPKCLQLLGPEHYYTADGRLNVSKCRRCISWGKAKVPAEPAGRRVLARTCTRCETLCMEDDFYEGEWVCKVCSVKRAVSWQESNPEQYARTRRRMLRGAYSDSLEGAHHHRDQWTGPELEVIARDDLTIRQKAEMLGRTVYAVQAQRHLVQKDPRKSSLAGTP